jgi:hypothetical protein
MTRNYSAPSTTLFGDSGSKSATGGFKPQELEVILDSFKPKPFIDRDAFAAQVERAVAFYESWSRGERNHSIKNSDAKRAFGRLRKALVKLRRDVEATNNVPGDRNLSRRINRGLQKTARSLEAITANVDFQERLLDATDQITVAEGAPPDCKPELYQDEDFSHAIPIWPLEDQNAKAFESSAGLACLERITERAEANAELEIDLANDKADDHASLRAGSKALTWRRHHKNRRSGNRPNEPLQWLVRMLVEFYREAAVSPSSLTYNNTKEEGVEIFYFLHACLHPLGISLSFVGLRALCRRANVA